MKKHITTCRLAKKIEHDSNKSSVSRGENCGNTDDGEHTELHMGLQPANSRPWETVKVKCPRFSRK